LNINTKNVSKAEELIETAKNDIISFGKLFLPDDFGRSETPWFHYQIVDAIDDMDGKLHKYRNLAIIMPRGHGKTVLTKADIMRSFCFAEEPLFYGWVSATQKLAVGNMDYVKTHLEYNEQLKYYFGDMKGRKWTEQDIELKNGCKLISKSNISGIRGGAKLHKRYDLVVLDDFEDENNTLTSESRSKNANMVTAVVAPALEPHDGRLRINGTPVHYDSFINNLIVNYEKAQSEDKDFSWKVMLYKAVHEDGEALWHSWFPLSKLTEKKKFYVDSGKPHKFYQEYMMEVQSAEDSIFNMRHVKYWEGFYKFDDNEMTGYIYNDGDKIPVNIFAGVDPATDSERRDSDYSVIMVIACDINANVYVIDYIRRRSLPVLGIPGEDKKGIVDYMFELNEKYNPILFTVEDTSMSKPIFQALRSEMRRKNDFSLSFKEEKPGTKQSKLDRIQEVLAQRMSIGAVRIRDSHYDLQHEILTFGKRMAHDDTIDALAYAVKYSHPPNGTENQSGDWIKKALDNPKSWVLA
jgi:phage terminase large subunit-like protein